MVTPPPTHTHTHTHPHALPRVCRNAARKPDLRCRAPKWHLQPTRHDCHAAGLARRRLQRNCTAARRCQTQASRGAWVVSAPCPVVSLLATLALGLLGMSSAPQTRGPHPRVAPHFPHFHTPQHISTQQAPVGSAASASAAPAPSHLRSTLPSGTETETASCGRRTPT